MRILDTNNNKALTNVILYLKLDEAKQMLDYLSDLVKYIDSNEHVHINDFEFKHEITLVLYKEDNLEGFDKRSKILIREDK